MKTTTTSPRYSTLNSFEQADDLLTRIQPIMEKLLASEAQIVQDTCRNELRSLVTDMKAGPAASKVLRSLDWKGSMRAATDTPTLENMVWSFMRNTHDDKMFNPNNRASSVKQIERHRHTRDLQVLNLISVITRLRSKHAMPMLNIRRAIEYKYLCCSEHLWNISRLFREVPGESWIDNALSEASVRSWRPPCEYACSLEIDLCCRDNLEWWRRLKYARTIKGVKKESELIHTVTGEHWYVPASLTLTPDPELGNSWPFMGNYNYSDTVVNDAEMQVFLEPLWSKALALIQGNTMQLMCRAPPEADMMPNRGITGTWHARVILNCGTSSYIDNATIIKSVRANRKAKKSIVACDMQTFVRIWWLKHKFPEQYKDVVPWAGEFHGLAHLVDGIVIMNWAYIYEPILLHFEVTGFHLKLNMQETSQRIRWSIVILSGGLLWLQSVFTPSELSNIPLLLTKVKGNVPVWCFIGFLYYNALAIWGFKDAIQVSDNHLLNFMWRFSLRVYAHTNKNNYKKGVLQNSKILFDSEERVQRVMRHHRTYNDTGRPCAGGGLDHKNEKVAFT